MHQPAFQLHPAQKVCNVNPASTQDGDGGVDRFLFADSSCRQWIIIGGEIVLPVI